MTNPGNTAVSDGSPDLSGICEILELYGSPAFCVSADGRILFANRNACESAGMVCGHVPGQPARNIDARLTDWPEFFKRLRADISVVLEPEHNQTDPGLAAYEVQARFWQPLGMPLAVILLRDVNDEQERQSGLVRRDVILQVMSRAASRFLADEDWDACCNALLKDLGQATGVSRVYIFEAHYDENNLLLFSQRYEWVAPGITAQIDNPDLQNIPMEAAGYSRWQDLLSRGRLVAGQVRDFPESERELLESQSILSLAVVPVFTSSQWWGMLGLDECSRQRDWGLAETEALRTVASLFGLATERREAARLAREKRDSVAHEARLITMGEMASSIAHEINQPLAAVNNYCESGLAALEAGAVDREIFERAFRSAAAQARRAGEIIRRLRLFLSKGETRRTLVDLNELVRETLDLVAHDARARNIRLLNEAAADLAPALVCRVQLQQVLVNLVRNGIEAIEEAGDDSQRTLRVRSEQLNPGLLRISVMDTGAGLDPALAELIFEPFETSKPGGMGLGLSISRTIMEAHGGSLSADRSFRGGACFHLNLPSLVPEENA